MPETGPRINQQINEVARFISDYLAQQGNTDATRLGADEVQAHDILEGLENLVAAKDFTVFTNRDLNFGNVGYTLAQFQALLSEVPPFATREIVLTPSGPMTTSELQKEIDAVTADAREKIQSGLLLKGSNDVDTYNKITHYLEATEAVSVLGTREMLQEEIKQMLDAA